MAITWQLINRQQTTTVGVSRSSQPLEIKGDGRDIFLRGNAIAAAFSAFAGAANLYALNRAIDRELGNKVSTVENIIPLRSLLGVLVIVRLVVMTPPFGPQAWSLDNTFIPLNVPSVSPEKAIEAYRQTGYIEVALPLSATHSKQVKLMYWGTRS